jgi:hypothetical protein
MSGFLSNRDCNIAMSFEESTPRYFNSYEFLKYKIQESYSGIKINLVVTRNKLCTFISNKTPQEVYIVV